MDKFPIHQITAHREGSGVTISPAQLEIPHDGAVQWIVTGLADHEVAEVLIGANRVSELGPFSFTRAGGGSIWARGSSGFGGDYEYRIVIYNLAGGLATAKAVASSAPARLAVGAPPERLRTGQTVQVTHLPNDQGGELVVHQLETRFVGGDPVLFEFQLPADLFKEAWLPSLLFEGNPPAPNRGYGPFASLSVVDGASVVGERDGTLRRFLVASGESGLYGRFNYRAVVRSVSGDQVVSSPDPVLDNDGEVVCPGCSDDLAPQGGK